MATDPDGQMQEAMLTAVQLARFTLRGDAESADALVGGMVGDTAAVAMLHGALVTLTVQSVKAAAQARGGDPEELLDWLTAHLAGGG